MKTPGNLSDLTQRVNLYLDNALSQEDERNLLEEVDSNPDYRSVLDSERSFRNFIKNHVHRSNVSPDLIRTIKDKIRVV